MSSTLTTMNVRDRDDHNLTLVDSSISVDETNASFYSRFPYPPPAATFDCPSDSELFTQLVNQNLGAFTVPLIPCNANIWVPGCGTNQAIYTALRFPQANVIGSDISVTSLSVASKMAADIGIQNLTLLEESLNQSDYQHCFDYIICTGVIHHSANPADALKKLAASLKPSGILELMVYNRYHRLLPQAFQKAVRLFVSQTNARERIEAEIAVARKIARNFTTRNLLRDFLVNVRDLPEPEMADILIQPVEYSYTVQSLEDLANSCGMSLSLPCPDHNVGSVAAVSWYVELRDKELKHVFESLPDIRRWQIANLLLLEQSPMLWFYLQHSSHQRISEKEVNHKFLSTVFERITATRRCYVRKPSGAYELSPQQTPFYRGLPEGKPAEIYRLVDGSKRMEELFELAGIPQDLGSVSNVRLALATSSFPYLKAANPGK